MSRQFGAEFDDYDGCDVGCEKALQAWIAFRSDLREVLPWTLRETLACFSCSGEQTSIHLHATNFEEISMRQIGYMLVAVGVLGAGLIFWSRAHTCRRNDRAGFRHQNSRLATATGS